MLYNLKLEWRRYWQEMVNFKVNLFFGNIGLLTLFTGLLGTLDIQNRETVFILMFIWYSATHGFMNINFIIEEEIMDGTLAHIVGTRISFLWVIFLRSLFQIIYDLVKSGIVFSIVFCLLPFDFSLFQVTDYGLIIVLVLYCIAISYFIGLILGVLALKYKKIPSLPNLLYYFVFFFGGVTAEVSNVLVLGHLAYLFPFMPMRGILLALQSGTVGISYIIILLVQGCFYLMTGLILYHFIMRENFRKGRLCHV